MTGIKESLVEWLRDAHAMEANLVDMLEKQSAKLRDHPELKFRIDQHAAESRQHASLVEDCLKRLGQDTSMLKDGIAKLAGKLSPLAMAMADDAPLKIVLANYASENFEIACYRSLQTAAEQCGEEWIAQTVSQILHQEEQMAEYLGGQIETLTCAHLSDQANDH